MEVGEIPIPSVSTSWISLIHEYQKMPDVKLAYMQGGGMPRHWVCPIYGASAEIEVLDLLYFLTRLLKPTLVVEAGCHLGLGSFALGRAIMDNGFGKVITSDIDPVYVDATKDRCLGLPVEVRECSVDDIPEVTEADFAFLDSSYETRVTTLARMKAGSMAAMHDTEQSPELAKALVGYQHVCIPTWRGLALIRK